MLTANEFAEQEKRFDRHIRYALEVVATLIGFGVGYFFYHRSGKLWVGFLSLAGFYTGRLVQKSGRDLFGRKIRNGRYN